MNPFADLPADSSDIGGDQDRLGGSFIWPSGAYEVTIKNAYSGKAASGAKSMTFEVEDATGKRHRWTEYVTSGDAKGNLPYYEKDGKKNFLPGYNIANAICTLASKKGLKDQTWETKQVKIYNKDTKSEVPTPTPVAVDLLGKKIILGILEVETNKSIKVGNAYKRTAETKKENRVDKIFFAENKCTLNELINAKKAGSAPVAAFYDQWVSANEGKVKDDVKAAEVQATQGGAAAPTSADGAEVDSLFD